MSPVPTGPARHDDGRTGAEGPLRTVVRGLRLSPGLRRGLGGTLVLALLATAGRAIVPVAVQQTIDRGLLGSRGVDLAAVVAAVGLAAVAVGITAVASRAMNVRLVTSVEDGLADLRVRAFRHVHDLSVLHQAEQRRGSLVARVTTDVDEISRFMSWGGLNLLTALGQLTVATIVMVVYSWELALAVLATFVPFALAGRWFQQRLTDAYQRVRERVGDLLGAIAETVVGAAVVRAYGVERRTQDRLDHAIDRHRAAAIHAGSWSAWFSGAGELFSAVATAVVVVVGAWLAAAGEVSGGTVVAFLFLVSLFVDPVLIAAETVNEGQTAVAGWRRVLDVLDLVPDVADPEDGRALPPGPLGIRFEGVGFRYPRPGETGASATGPWVLTDLDVAIAPHQHVAVVGETGSGKTTFAKLLTRLMDPTVGRITIGEVPLDEVAFSSLRRRVVMVPQDGTLFSGTIADNVRMGLAERPGGAAGGDVPDVGPAGDVPARDVPADDDPARGDPVRLAFVELGLADWLAELPHGLATPVGERGGALSAGERQLVALARAYVANPDLLVLDEATSAVDPATEVRLRRALSGLTRGRTTVTVAHRLATAEAADQVLVFDAGRIVQRGRHADLVAQGGVYGALHDSWRRSHSHA